jgi:hypothetical protein
VQEERHSSDGTSIAVSFCALPKLLPAPIARLQEAIRQARISGTVLQEHRTMNTSQGSASSLSYEQIGRIGVTLLAKAGLCAGMIALFAGIAAAVLGA